MKKWMIALLTLTFSIATIGVVAGFTLTGGGGGDNPEGTSSTDTPHGDPTYEQWLDDFGPVQGPITSIDDIDPDKCNLIHNITACSPEELEALGGAHLLDGPSASSQVCAIEVPDCNDTLVVENGDEGGEIEPFFDEEDVRDLNFQTLEDAIRQDCALAGGTVYVTSDGEVGCIPGEVGDDVGFSPGEPPHTDPLPPPAGE